MSTVARLAPVIAASTWVACATPPEAPPTARPIAPLSTSTVTTRAPTFRWELAPGYDGARVELCRDRALTEGCASFDATGSSGAPPESLASGIWFWRLRAQVAGETELSAGPIWQIVIPTRSAEIATASGTFLDVDGDAIADVLAMTNYEGTLVFRGSPGGLARDAVALAPNPGHSFTDVASAGDVDGDGYGDIVLATAGTHDVVYVYPGGPAGLWTEPQIVPIPITVGWLQSARSAGDVDGDGYADVVLGSAHILRGSASGLLAEPIALSASSSERVFALAPPGDFDGDGFSDVVLLETQAGAGAVHEHRGGPGGPSATARSISVPSLTDDARDPASVADVNGDGRSDLVLRQSERSPHAADVFFGAASGLDGPPMTISLAASARHGAVCATDVDGDGYADVVVLGQPEVTPGALFPVANAYVYRGGPAGPAPLPIVTPVDTDLTLMVAVGDVDGDGFGDIAVASYGGWSVSFGSATAVLGRTIRLGLNSSYLAAVAAARRDRG